MKTKLKIIIPIIVAVAAIIIAALTINFTSNQMSDIDSLIKDGYYYLNDVGDFDEAIAIFNKIISLDPMNVDAYMGLAQAYQGKGDIDKAIETLKTGYEKTDDQRLKDKLDELSPSEETTAVTTIQTTVTTTETETETDQTAITTTVLNDEERILNQVIEELSKFVPNKQHGTPNSVKYSYYEEYNDFRDYPMYHCFKFEYGNNGSIINEYEVVFSIIDDEKMIYNYDEVILTTYDHDYYYLTKKYCKLPNSNYIVYESSVWEIANQRVSYDELSSSSEIVKISDKEYLAETYNGDYKICLNDNEVYSLENTKYESYSYTLKNGALYKYDDFGTYITPCKDGLPDKISESDFYIPTDNIDKTFTNYLEYCDYARLKWESIGR